MARIPDSIRGERATALALFLLCLALRWLLLNQYTASPYYDTFGWDPKAYDEWATAIAAGDFGAQEAFHQAPLYPYWLALLYKLTGRDFYLVFLAQVLLSSLSAVLLYRLGRDFFDRRTGLLAAVIFCFHGMLAFYTVKLLSETLVICLYLLIVERMRQAGEQPSLRAWAACGLLTGLAIIAKPNAALLVPLAGLYLLFAPAAASRLSRNDSAMRPLTPTLSRGEREIPFTGAGAALSPTGTCPSLASPSGRGPISPLRMAGYFAAFAAAAALIVLPVTLHNYLAEGDWVLVSWNGGGNLCSGNNPAAVGLPEPLPGVSQDRLWGPADERAVVRQALGVPPTAGTVSRYWTAQALDFVGSQPTAFLRLILKKLRLSLSGMENSHMYYLGLEREHFTPFLRVFVFNFYSVSPLAAAGLLFSWRHWRRLLPLYAMLAVTYAALLLFYVLSRLRLPAEPFLILFAAWTVSEFLKPAGRSPGRVAVVLACCALSAAMYFADRNKFPGRAAVNWYNLGELYFEQGRYAEAQAAYSRSLALNPNQGYTALGACKLFVARRQPERAVDLVRRIRPMMDEELKRDFLREPHLAVIRKDLRRILEETDVEPTREP